MPYWCCLFYKNHYHKQVIFHISFFTMATSHFFSLIKRTGIFDICVRLLLVLLPFTTVITVVGKERIGLPFIWFYKEILLLILILTLAWYDRKKTVLIKWSAIDWIIMLYIANLLIISFFTTGMSGIVYGWRYDFSFLILFWVIYHGSSLLKKGVAYYVKLALVSMSIMIVISALLKFPFSEDLLLYLGFSGNPSAWEFSWVPPIFHGIDGANVRRFQGILDGPNTMGAFLIMFVGLFTYYFRAYRAWYFVNGGVILAIFILVLYTYSRSATLWMIVGIWIALLGSMWYILKRYKKEFLTLSLLGIIFVWVLSLQYRDKIDSIIWRAWSTKWHFERMTVGIERVTLFPLGQWLGSAGPAYRYVQKLETIDQKTREEKDRFYIPESWYIQQFIEWWIVWWVCFIILIGILIFKLWKRHIFLASMFIWICFMNFFLHTFESSPLSLLLFTLLGIIIWSPITHKKE